MTEKRKSAVSWLEEKLIGDDEFNMKYAALFEQAKALEREQIVESYIEGRKDCELDWYPQKHASDYFTKTYGDNVKNDLQNGVNL